MFNQPVRIILFKESLSLGAKFNWFSLADFLISKDLDPHNVGC